MTDSNPQSPPGARLKAGPRCHFAHIPIRSIQVIGRGGPIRTGIVPAKGHGVGARRIAFMLRPLEVRAGRVELTLYGV